MKKGFVFCLLVMCLSINEAMTAVATNRHEEEVSIYFEKDSSGARPQPSKPKDRDIISVQKPKNRPKLPKTGQMITSMMVLLSGIVVILIVSMIYLMSKKREEEL